MNAEEFRALMSSITGFVGHRSLDAQLERDLNQAFPASGPMVQAIESACHDAIRAGWMCAQGAEGRRFGRVFEPSRETDDLSVDVVDLTEIVGPHHRHPNGEICLVMPVTPTARFDGKGAGWCVYGPASAHHPTVHGGWALVLYLLPGGKIEFTKQ